MIEISKNAVCRIKNVKMFILDMDGTFYLGDELLPHAAEFADFLKQKGLDFIFLTNNSSKSRNHYALKLARLGYPVPAEKIFTSGEATIDYLLNHTDFRSIYLAGTPSLESEFRDAGFSLTHDNPQCAVLGFDMTLTYEKLTVLYDLVTSGKPYIATHPDILCPVGEKKFIPDIGAMIACVEKASGRKPDIIIGKPHDTIIRMLLKKIRKEKHEIAFIGDRLYTDIAAGKNASILTVLTLTGETSMEDLNEDSEIMPDIVINDLSELMKII
jgi:HAD superfamily hydrolase (TIGR01450 family)